MVGAFIISELYLFFSPIGFQVGTQIDALMGGYSLGGLTVAQFTARNFALFGDAVVFSLIFLGVLFFGSLLQTEYDQGQQGESDIF